MKSVRIRFYEELNDFLPEEKRKVRFDYNFKGTPSVKDLIESVGIPHSEIDMILVNDRSVNFNYLVKDKDDISVYPVFESFDISEVQKLRPEPLRYPKFILDVHLGKLCKFMRLMGFDTSYSNDMDDETIVIISLKEKRTILTRDVGLLKRGNVTHGYFIRNTDPKQQVKEVVDRFHLQNRLNQFTRCLICNRILDSINKDDILNRIPDKVKLYQNDFYICENCDKIYWAGTHFEDMSKTLKEILS